MTSPFSAVFTSDHLCIESTLYTLDTCVVWSKPAGNSDVIYEQPLVLKTLGSTKWSFYVMRSKICKSTKMVQRTTNPGWQRSQRFKKSILLFLVFFKLMRSGKPCNLKIVIFEMCWSQNRDCQSCSFNEDCNKKITFNVDLLRSLW